MKLVNRFSSMMISVLILLAVSAHVSAQADGDIVVKEAWVREAPPNAKVLAAYMTIENHSNKEKTLSSVTSSEFSKVEIHKTVHKGDMATMEQQKQLPVPAKGEVKLQPGGLHFMLFNPKKALKAGDSLSFTLKFSNGSSSTVKAEVKKATGGDSHHHHSDHSEHAEHNEHADHSEHKMHEEMKKESGDESSHHHHNH